MSLNFNFLKQVNENLFGLAKNIEQNRSKSPEAVLCMGTTFLDNMVYDICQKSYYPFEDISSIERVNNLENVGIISPQLADHLVDGFKVRNNMHKVIDSVKGYLFDNKYRAKKLYAHIYKAACLYYKEFHDNTFYQTYKDPDMIKKIFEKEDVCPICGAKTYNESILCGNCEYDIELLDHLNSMVKRIGFDNNFSKKKMQEIGFTKSESLRISRDLRNKEVIRKSGITYSFNKEEILKYREKIADFEEIRNIILDININDLNITQIKNTEAYIKGSNGQEPFVQFYNSIYNKLSNDFLEEIENIDYIKLVDSKRIFNKEEFIGWAKQHLDNKTLFNQLKGHYLKYKKQCADKECIMENLYIDNEILGFLINHKDIIDATIELRKENYLQALTTFKTFDQALEISKLTQIEVDQYRKEDVGFRNKYYSEVERRKGRFLVELKSYGFEDAFKKSKLKEKHLTAESDKQIKSEFYKQMMQILQDKFLNYRKEGKTERQAIDLCQIEDEMYEKWLNNPNFEGKLGSIELELLFKSIKNGETIADALKIANMRKREFNKYMINAYENNREEIIELYEKTVLPNECKRFLKEFNSRNEKDALKKAKFDKRLFDIALEKDQKFVKDYFELKLLKYVSLRLTKNHKHSLKNSGLTQAEYEENKEDLEEKLENLRIAIVVRELAHKKTTKQAAKKAGVKVKDIYDWYRQGQFSVGKFREFADLFEAIYIKHPIEKYSNLLVDRNFFYKFILHKKVICKEDEKFWKKLHIDEKFPLYEFFTIETPTL